MRFAVVVAALALTPLAAAATPAQIAADLSHQRVSNGIPGGIQLEQSWTRGCQHHIRYDELNGIAWTHEETRGKPGYTQDGRLAGAMGAVPAARSRSESSTRPSTRRSSRMSRSARSS